MLMPCRQGGKLAPDCQAPDVRTASARARASRVAATSWTADDGCPMGRGDHGSGHAPQEPVRGWLAGCRADERFPRRTDQQRPTQLRQLAQAPQQGQVLRAGLRETQAGIPARCAPPQSHGARRVRAPRSAPVPPRRADSE